MTRTPSEVLTGAATTSVWPPVLAVDPGGRWTGVCLRAGRLAVEAMTVPRLGTLDDHRSTVAFAERVLEEAEALLARSKPALTRLAERWERDPTPVRWAVETFVAPSRWRGGKAASAVQRFASSGPVGVQVGMLVGRHGALLVPPHGDGGWDNLPTDAYPSTLTGRTPEGWRVLRDDKGRSPARSHQRAAYALAGAAHLLYPTGAAGDSQEPVQPTPAPRLDRATEVKIVRTLMETSKDWTVAAGHWRKPRVLIRCVRQTGANLDVEVPDERIPRIVRAVALGLRRADADALRDRVAAAMEKDLGAA